MTYYNGSVKKFKRLFLTPFQKKYSPIIVRKAYEQ